MLKRRFLLLLFVVFNIAACTTVQETAVAPQPSQPIPTVPTPELATPLPIEETILPTTLPTETVPPTITPSPIPNDLSLDASQIFLYPTPQIYDGDLVTFQILAYVPEVIKAEHVQVHIWVDNQLIVEDIMGSRNLSGNAVGLYEWVWDTTDQTGPHQITVMLDPDDLLDAGDENPNNNQASFTTQVEDSELLPPGERNASWVTAETECCIVHVVTETAAYRDLAFLLSEVEFAFQQATAMLGEPPSKKYDVYLVDKVIGQGGYAGPAMVVSYPDRHYANNGLRQVMIHEAVHLMDRQFAPQRITFLAEGVAVWASGGHYKPEDIDQRSAALVESGRYIPLTALINDFYPVQHEIGYLEAAGFVSYLVNIYGWNQFKTFYADVTRDDGATLAEAVDLNLQKHFGMTLAQAESEWLSYLAQLPYSPDNLIDLETSIRFYETMRTYQRFYDPTAYFLTAWLPYPKELETHGNPADLTRNVNDEINVTLEVMLQAAEQALRNGNYERANTLLDSIERTLTHNGAFIDPLAISYLEVVQTATARGYIVQGVEIDGTVATVEANPIGSTNLENLSFSLFGSGWIATD